MNGIDASERTESERRNAAKGVHRVAVTGWDGGAVGLVQCRGFLLNGQRCQYATLVAGNGGRTAGLSGRRRAGHDARQAGIRRHDP